MKKITAISTICVIASFFTISSCKEPEEQTFLPTITLISVTEINPISVSVNAEITKDGGAAISEAGVCWAEARVPSILDNGVKVPNKSIGTFTSPVNGLKINTTYYFCTYASNKNGTAYSNVILLTTGSSTQTNIVLKPATKITLKTATIGASIVPNQENTTVTFQYGTDTLSLQSIPVTPAYSGKDTVRLSLDLTNLQVGTKYVYRVKTNNAYGEVSSKNGSFVTYAVSDIDGNLYHTVQIGNQTWLQENLKTTHYRNGDPIANVTNMTDWWNLNTGAYCWYNNDTNIGNVYGALYNWYTVNDPRGLAIPGWHVPTTQEWATLSNFLGGYTEAGPKMMETGSVHWVGVTLSNITNSASYTALPNGAIGSNIANTGGSFMQLGELATWWVSDAFGENTTMAEIASQNAFLTLGRLYAQKIGAGVRLIRD